MKNTFLKIPILILIVTIFVNLWPSTLSLAKEPIVHAVLFFSPSCPHCHTVIAQHLPPLQEKYGNRLQVLQIDVSQPGGQAIYQSTIQKFNISDDRLGVPTLIVGSAILVGSREIPEQFPGVIEEGLTKGGIPWPNIPGLDVPKDPEISEEIQQESLQTGWMGKFNRDLIANTIAVIVLIGMLFSIVVIAIAFINEKILIPIKWSAIVIPIVTIFGLGVATYLSFVETTKTQAFCGPIGDCNTVQQSSYARLFGILPVGNLGMVGYLGILAAWLIQQYAGRPWRRYVALAIWAMVWFGVLFSIYLTFLEPFVIGATCAWCVTSAISMTVLLWVTTGPAQVALQTDNDMQLEGSVA